MSVSRYLHTVRYLKPVQVYRRVLHTFQCPSIDVSPAPVVRVPAGAWSAPAQRQPSLLSPCRFLLLGEDFEIQSAADWNDASRPKLMLYNLHYFDDLNSHGSIERRSWHTRLIDRWIDENPPASFTGWEPYPLSLRIVNWIKWVLAGGTLVGKACHSLAVQVRYLAENIEYHLLGNHLLSNAKALIFAGTFFSGLEADRWRNTGLELFLTQLREQVLHDGGHFELSPMYHSLVLEDVLDIINLLSTYLETTPPGAIQELRLTAASMLDWILTMCHPDGEIALFSDAAHGMAPSPTEIRAYAQRLGVGSMLVAQMNGVRQLGDSGYCRIQFGNAVLFTDIAKIGAKYLPGHGHADVLSFELSLFGRRFVVDSGTSEYGDRPERLRQKGTAAHNTVVVDGKDSSELWGGFRIAQRAHPFDARVLQSADNVAVSAAHDGYNRLAEKVTHRRMWTMSEHSLHIVDDLVGRGKHRLDLPLHFHPDFAARAGPANAFSLYAPDRTGTIVLRYDNQLEANIEPSTYHPRFGSSVPACKIVGRCHTVLPVRLQTIIEW